MPVPPRREPINFSEITSMSHNALCRKGKEAIFLFPLNHGPTGAPVNA